MFYLDKFYAGKLFTDSNGYVFTFFNNRKGNACFVWGRRFARDGLFLLQSEYYFLTGVYSYCNIREMGRQETVINYLVIS